MVENNDIIVVYLHCSNFKQQGAQLHSVQLIKARWAQNVCGFFFLKRPATICADICSPLMLISASFAFKDAISNSPLCSKAGIHCAALGEPLGCR